MLYNARQVEGYFMQTQWKLKAAKMQVNICHKAEAQVCIPLI